MATSIMATKYYDDHNNPLRMNLCFLFIIVLDITHLVYCSNDSESTNDELHPTCPNQLYRNKREQTSYMRWLGNLESSSEFILKIPDDEETGPITRGGVPPSMLHPQKINADRIIVGGAVVPTPTRPSPVQPTRTTVEDYTRFKPPADAPVNSIEEIFLAAGPTNDESLNRSLHIESVQIGLPATTIRNFVPVKNPHRDESPPASPQFLPRRTSVLPARQYAPVNTVAFSPQSTLPPITPRIRFDNSRRLLKPTVDTDVMTPARTTTDKSDLPDYVRYIVEDPNPDSDSITRTTKFYNVPHRSTTNLDLDFDNKLDQDDNTLEARGLGLNEAPGIVTLTTASDGSYKDDELVPTIGDKVPKSEESYDDKYSETYNDDSIENEIIENGTETHKETKYNEEYYDNIGVKANASKRLYNASEAIEDIEAFASIKWRATDQEVCSLLKLRSLRFNSPRTLKEIVTQLRHWSENSPMVKLTDITEGNLTTMENPIYLMIVDDPSSGQIVSAKKTVMIVAGILGRDHHAVAAAMYVLYQLIDRSDAHNDLLSKFRFWIIPVFNPDGYDYSMTFPHRKGWTKNLRQTFEPCRGKESCKDCDSSGIRCVIQPCFGTNLDRNFEYQWIPANQLHADKSCGELYPGLRQLSEPESKALSVFMHKPRQSLYMFIAFKEGDVLGIMYPYSHTRKRRAHDLRHRQRAAKAASAAQSISGRNYVHGQCSEFLPLYAGGIEDWMDGHFGVDNTFTVMMYRTSDTDNSRLLMERVVHEAYAAMDTLLLITLPEPAPTALQSLKHAQPLRISSQTALRPAPLITVAVALTITLLFI